MKPPDQDPYCFPPWLKHKLTLLFCLFLLLLYAASQRGHGGTVSSPNHTFSWASLNKQFTSTSCTYFRLQLTTTLLEWFSRTEENDCRNYFMINLHESMGPGRDQTSDPWICRQTRICCQTHYWLRYAARSQAYTGMLLINMIKIGEECSI